MKRTVQIIPDLTNPLAAFWSTTEVCDKCKQNDVEIFHEQGDFCLSCWQEVTSPI